MRNYDRRLLPGVHAKRIVIDFITKWFQQNAVFQIKDGTAESAPQPLGPDEVPQIRGGDRGLVVRDGWGANDPADLKRKVVVSRGPYRKTRRHIGNLQGPIQIVDNKGVIHQGEVFTSNSDYHIQAMCCSSVGTEADELAQIIGEAFDFSRIPLRTQYRGLRDIVDIQVGQETLIDRPSSRTQLVGVPVDLVLDIQYDWLVFDMSGTLLKGFLLQAVADEDFVQSEVGGICSWPNS